MPFLEDLPVELLLRILYLATHPDHPMALDHPLINWHSPRTLLFNRTRGLQREALATKAAICSVCRHWNTLAFPWLYEHIVVDNARKLRSVNLLPLTNSSLRSLSYVQRLDVELPEGDMLWPFVAVVEILRSLPNLTTLVMFFARSFSSHNLLPYIPKSVERLYWSTPKDDAKSLPEAPMDIDIPVLLDFLDGHPALETVSLPFIFCFSNLLAIETYESRTPQHSVQEWVMQETFQWLVFGIVGLQRGLMPNVSARTLTYEWPESGMTALLTGSPSYPPTGFVQDTGAHLKITNLSFVVHLPDRVWPPRRLLDGLPTIASLCPNLREFDLTFTADDESSFISPLEAVRREIAQVPQVTCVSIQRVLTGSTEISDLEGTLHHVLRLPWKDMFPSLQCIRVREDMDLDTLVRHPTMVFAKSEESGIRYEDRFGEQLF